MQMEYIKCLGNSGLVLDLLVKRLWKVATGYHPEETERPCIHSLVRILILWYTGKKEVSTYLRYWYLGSLCFAVAVTNLRDGSLTCWKFWWKLAKGCRPEENTRQCMIFFVRIECFLTIQLSKGCDSTADLSTDQNAKSHQNREFYDHLIFGLTVLFSNSSAKSCIKMGKGT